MMGVSRHFCPPQDVGGSSRGPLITEGFSTIVTSSVLAAMRGSSRSEGFLIRDFVRFGHLVPGFLSTTRGWHGFFSFQCSSFTVMGLRGSSNIEGSPRSLLDEVSSSLKATVGHSSLVFVVGCHVLKSSSFGGLSPGVNFGGSSSGIFFEGPSFGIDIIKGSSQKP